MKKLLVGLWLAALFGSAFAQCPIKSASEKVVFPLLCLDTLGRNATPDSAHITTYKDDASFATYFTRSTTFPFSGISIDTTRPGIGGTAPVNWWYNETISNIDGTASNATLGINVQLWWKGYATDNRYCVQMVADSLNDAIWRAIAYLTTSTFAANVTQWNGTNVSSPATAGIPDVNVKNINNVAAATPGASGGVLISGSNTGTTTFGALTSTGAFTISGGLAITNSTSNGAGATITGNGTGNGVTITSGNGATGNALAITAASTNGNGVVSTGTGTGDAINLVAAGSGDGLDAGAGDTGGGSDIVGDLSGTLATVTTLTTKTGFSLASTGSDADTGIVAIKTKLTTIAGYTDDIGTAGAGLTSVKLASTGSDADTGIVNIKTKLTTISGYAKSAQDTINAHAPHANNWGGTAAGGSGADSGQVSRIVARSWGVQLGTSGSSDSLSAAQRQSAISPSSARLGVNTLQLNGTSQTARDLGASVLLSSGTGTGQISLSSGAVTVGTNNDKTGYTASTVSDKTGYSLTTSYLDSSGTSRVLGRKLFGIAAGTGSDSLTKAQRITGASQASDTINAHAPHGNNWATTGASAVTPDTIRDIVGDSLGTFATPRALRDTIWLGAGSRNLTSLDEDSTQIDVNGTTIGTATNLTNAPTSGDLTATMKSSIGTQVWTTSTPRQLTGAFADTVAAKVWGTGTKAITSVGTGGITSSSFASGAIDATAIATNALHFGTEIDTVGNEQGVKTEATTGGGGATAADIWSYATRTLTSGAVSASVYPLIQITTTVDAPGTLDKYQFVIDTTAAGGSNEYALLNKGVVLRDTSASWGKPYFNGIIERANCVAGLCTLQISDSCAFPIAAGDSLWILNLGPQYVMATLAEAATATENAVLDADTSDHLNDGSTGKSIARGGSSGADVGAIETMMEGHQVFVAAESTVVLSQTSTGAGVLRRAEVPTLPEVGDTLAGRIPDSTYAKGGVVDTARNATAEVTIDSAAAELIASFIGDTGCPDSGGYVFNIFAYDTLADEVVENVVIRTGTSLNSQLSTPIPTGTSGSVQYSFNSGKHYVSAQAPGYSFGVDSFTVSGAGQDTVYGAQTAAVGRTIVWGQATTFWGDSLSYATVQLELTNVADSLLFDSNGNQIAGLVAKTTADARGYWMIPAIPNADIDPNSRYVVRVIHPLIGTKVYNLTKVVPDAVSINVRYLY